MGKWLDKFTSGSSYQERESLKWPVARQDLPTHCTRENALTRKLEGTEPAAWNEALADAWLAVTLERVARAHADVAPTCPVSGVEWDKREIVIDAAYLIQSRRDLREALDAYELFALATFSAWTRQRR